MFEPKLNSGLCSPEQNFRLNIQEFIFSSKHIYSVLAMLQKK